MTPETVFNLSCGIAAVGWVVVWVISPFWKAWDKLMIGIICAMLAFIYCWMNFEDFQMQNIKNFSSLEGVIVDFQNKNLVNACWTHILAFDLVVAAWIKMNAMKHGIKHWMILPSLLLTCVLGPLGFLLYLLTRFIATRNYFASND